jgi:hypothetical protein
MYAIEQKLLQDENWPKICLAEIQEIEGDIVCDQ